jgi:hypothetical protein
LAMVMVMATRVVVVVVVVANSASALTGCRRWGRQRAGCGRRTSAGPGLARVSVLRSVWPGRGGRTVVTVKDARQAMASLAIDVIAEEQALAITIAGAAALLLEVGLDVGPVSSGGCIAGISIGALVLLQPVSWLRVLIAG